MRRRSSGLICTARRSALLNLFYTSLPSYSWVGRGLLRLGLLSGVAPTWLTKVCGPDASARDQHVGAHVCRPQERRAAWALSCVSRGDAPLPDGALRRGAGRWLGMGRATGPAGHMPELPAPARAPRHVRKQDVRNLNVSCRLVTKVQAESGRSQDTAMRLATLLVLFLGVLGLGGCVGDPKDRGPWHEWLHTQGLE